MVLIILETSIMIIIMIMSKSAERAPEGAVHVVEAGSVDEVIEVAGGHTAQKVLLTKLNHRSHLQMSMHSLHYSHSHTLIATQTSKSHNEYNNYLNHNYYKHHNSHLQVSGCSDDVKNVVTLQGGGRCVYHLQHLLLLFSVMLLLMTTHHTTPHHTTPHHTTPHHTTPHHTTPHHTTPHHTTPHHTTPHQPHQPHQPQHLFESFGGDALEFNLTLAAFLHSPREHGTEVVRAGHQYDLVHFKALICVCGGVVWCGDVVMWCGVMW